MPGIRTHPGKNKEVFFTEGRIGVTVWRVVAVMLALGAESWNLVNLTFSGERLSEHFVYFTVQSNLLFAAILLWMLSGARRPAWFPQLRGAATAYIILTGIIYAVLLAEPDEVWSWDISFTNLAQHRIVPIMAAIDWILVTSPRALRVRRAWTWMLYPIAYLACCWLRWGVDGWVPYPFLDPTIHGIAGLVPSTGQVLIAFVVGIYAVAFTSKLSHPPPEEFEHTDAEDAPSALSATPEGAKNFET